jgi:anaerobic selenocysteine-containing dehydrogenase
VSNDGFFAAKTISRRNFLHIGAAGGGVALLGFASTASPAAAAKVAKQTVNYQTSPNGQAHCGSCAFFQAPSGCQYVNGPITPSGWCVLYQPKK